MTTRPRHGHYSYTELRSCCGDCSSSVLVVDCNFLDLRAKTKPRPRPKTKIETTSVENKTKFKTMKFGLMTKSLTLLPFSWPSYEVTKSYDPWASRLLGYCGEILIGYSWRISALRQLKPGGDGFVHPDWRRNVAVNRDEWRSGLRGGHHPWPLLEDRSQDPPPQVLPPLDAPRRSVPAVVEWRSGSSVSVLWHKQNSQWSLPPDSVLADWSHGKGTFRVVFYWLSNTELIFSN